jgi:hypothetical protein
LTSSDPNLRTGFFWATLIVTYQQCRQIPHILKGALVTASVFYLLWSEYFSLMIMIL